MRLMYIQNLLLLICVTAPFIVSSQQYPEYGNNPAAGKYMQINGVKHYYETYGSGDPLLLIHGNSTATKGWKSQIEFFSKHYTVYSIDCRGRGKSDLGKDSLTYEQQAKDMAEFLRLLDVDSVMVVGKSDGGIIALLLGIYYPERISKIVAFSANLVPDSTALYPESIKEVHDSRIQAEEMLEKKDTTQNWLIIQQRNRMMEFQPHIQASDLQKIKVPVLVMSCDRDVIREEHTFFIYKSIPFANLCILPNEKHGFPKLNAELFNETVYRYLKQSFMDYSSRFTP